MQGPRATQGRRIENMVAVWTKDGELFVGARTRVGVHTRVCVRMLVRVYVLWVYTCVL